MHVIFAAWLLGSSVAVSATAGAPVQAVAPLSPAAGWATAYLVSTTLAAEYQAVVHSLPSSGPERLAALRSDAGRSLWLRARFAVAALQAKGQEVLGGGDLAHLVAEQEVTLRDSSATASVLARGAVVARAAESDPLSARSADVAAGFAAVAGSFPTPALRSDFSRLAPAFALPAPSCPLDYAAVQRFAAHQKQLLADTRGASLKDLLAPLAGWSDDQVRCLVFTLMAASPADKRDNGFEPLPLMRALAATNAPLSRDLSVRALVAVRQLQLGHYPETLSALMDLSDLDDSFRLPYELVQRVYSMRQKGGGAVALQGM